MSHVTVRYELPTPDGLKALAREQDLAITIYAATSPIVQERERAQVAVKSLFDDAIAQARGLGASAADLAAVRERQAGYAGTAELWTDVSRSLAILVSPDHDEVFVLPNRLEDAVHVGRHFALGQLLRAQGQQQEAFALTLSPHDWQLWHATGSTRAAVLPPRAEWARDAESAVPRGDRASLKRVGDEYQKSLLDGYTAYVVEAVRQELGALDPNGRIPLVVFANDPLASLFLARNEARRAVVVKGASDHLDAAAIDNAVRERLDALVIDDVNAALGALAEGDQSRVARDISVLARAAVSGAVDTLYFDFTATEWGTLDDETGAVRLAPVRADGARPGDPPGEDLLARIAGIVLSAGGKVVPVRGSDLDPAVWHAPALARLRFPLTR